MAYTKSFTSEDRAKALKIAKTDGNQAAAKAIGASVSTVNNWRKASAAPKKNGKRNGHARKASNGAGKQVFPRPTSAVNQRLAEITAAKYENPGEASAVLLEVAAALILKARDILN